MTEQALKHRPADEEHTEETDASPPARIGTHESVEPSDEPTTGVTEWTPEIPQDVTTAEAKLVYVYLWTMRRADVTDLSQVTRIPQIRLFPVLQALAKRGHVEREGLTFTIAAAQ